MSSHRTDPNLFMKPDPIPPRTSDKPDGNLLAWALSLVLLCCLAVGGMAWWGGLMERSVASKELPAAARMINPDHPTDRDITVAGKVRQVLSPTEFTIADTDRGELRVVVDSARTLPVGTHVRVTGRIQAMDRLPAEEESELRPGKRLPVIRAAQIEIAGEVPE